MKRLFSALGTALLVAACGSSREGGFTPPPPPPAGFETDAGLVEEPDSGTICVTSQQKAESVPLAMLVLIDRSGSMVGEKWDAATKAIRAFADRSEVVGMKMGIQFFPALGNTDHCDTASYKNLAVPIAPLPENVIPIQQRLAASAADGGDTPMGPALAGTIDAMRAFIAKEPMHQGVVILVTDGEPAGCSSSVSSVAATAASGVNPTSDLPSVRTFTVGMAGASFGSLDQIAQSGGSPKSFNVGSGAGAQQALIEALDEVRAGVISCEYTLPIPPASQGTLDFETVELEFTPGKNDPAVTIKKVADANACGATSGGYYYDNPNDPSKVVLCPASCSAVRGGTLDAKVDLVFGCIKTVK